MTTWTLSELGCNGDCHQGRKPCTCNVPIPFAGWMRFEPVVIVESGASVPHQNEEMK
jgi:hypothetical protein